MIFIELNLKKTCALNFFVYLRVDNLTLMRRILIQIGLLVMPILCLAQVSKQQAIETVMTDSATIYFLNNNVDFKASLSDNNDASEMSPISMNQQKRLIMNRESQPIRNLSAEVLADNNVSLAWDMPSGYESGTATIGWTRSDTIGDMWQYGFDSYMAHLYDAADLKNHNGWRINSVSFYKTTTWTYSACVWKQEEGGEMSLIHSQEIAGDLPMGINEVELDADIYIMPETKYWIGLRATLNAGQTGVYPFATDGGTVVLGKGLLGMLPDGSEWGSDSFGSVVSGNLWLKVEVEKQESDKWNVELGGNALNAYRLYRNSQLIKEIPYSFVTYFTDDNFVRDVEAEYCVTAVYGEDESERECATVTINGVQEDSAQCGVTISPNPTYGIVNIDGIMVSEATVYNALGQIIVKVFNTNVLTIEGARRGVYSMSLKDIDGNIITKKIVLK